MTDMLLRISGRSRRSAGRVSVRRRSTRAERRGVRGAPADVRALPRRARRAAAASATQLARWAPPEPTLRQSSTPIASRRSRAVRSRAVVARRSRRGRRSPRRCCSSASSAGDREPRRPLRRERPDGPHRLVAAARRRPAPQPSATPRGAQASTRRAPWRADLAALEQQLRTEFRATQTPRASRAPARGVGGRRRDLLRRVRALLEESEKRQQRELALRVAEVMRDVNAQRQADLVKIDRTSASMQNKLGVEVHEAAAAAELVCSCASSQRQ